jgi:hypothetical protein
VVNQETRPAGAGPACCTGRLTSCLKAEQVPALHTIYVRCIHMYNTGVAVMTRSERILKA